MRRVALGVLLACGCGRLGFDAASDAAVGAQTPQTVQHVSFLPCRRAPQIGVVTVIVAVIVPVAVAVAVHVHVNSPVIMIDQS